MSITFECWVDKDGKIQEKVSSPSFNGEISDFKLWIAKEVIRLREVDSARVKSPESPEEGETNPS